jgi:glycosyltransferase involved in cell wall biosynthesis
MESLRNKRIPISVIIVTKNEEKRLSACLKSISFAKDIVVIDSGSEDKTIEMAKSFGCRVFIEQWKGYGLQKQSALQKTIYKWVLSLDADERIPPKTAQAIIQTMQEPNAQAYSFPRKNFLHGKWIKHSGWWPDRVVRLFDKTYGEFKEKVHESWVTKGKIVHLNSQIEHYSFKDYCQMIKKLDEYSTITSKELFNRGIKTNPLDPLIHGWWMFIKTYFLKLGILDGFDGFIISLLNAGGSFFKYAKLLELQRYERPTKRL